MKRISILLAPLFLMTILTILACETDEDRAIEKARTCIDAATRLAFSTVTSDQAQAPAKALECDSLVANFSGKEANQILFGAILIEQGKMSQIANMVSALKANSGGVDGLNTAFSILAFGDQSGITYTGSQNATRITTAGNRIGSGAQSIAAIIQMATALKGISDFAASDPAAVRTAINCCATGVGCSAACTAAQKQSIADAAIAFQTGACASPTDNASTDPNNACYKAKQITGGSTDATTIINALNTYTSSPH